MSRIGKTQVFSTAGAIPVKNEKGQLAMEKVKVQRYIAGKRPEFADDHSSGSESSEDEREREGATFVKPQLPLSKHTIDRDVGKELIAPRDDAKDFVEPKVDVNDPRFRRLMQRSVSNDDDDDRDVRHRRRHIEEPEIIKRADRPRRSPSPSSEDNDDEPRKASPRRRHSDASGEEDDMNEEELERRRAVLRLKAKEREREEELLAQQEESDKESVHDEEESEYEEYSESDEEAVPRLKPVFVRKRDRLTLQETEREQQRLNELQLEQKKTKEERKRQTVKMVENLVKQEMEMEKKKDEEDRYNLDAVNTDDENEEMAYEAWKLRELKRLKRDKEEREQFEREKAELDRIHSMTEEERRAYLRANPKVIVNKAQKGKYKFLQKYYHRGVFYLDEEDEVYKRNFAEPTLEDQFDKSVLPKVMQVKDFGKAGRTKWTHLVAEDTTDFQNAWNADTQQNIKFHQKHSAGVKDVFERPSAAKKRRKV